MIKQITLEALAVLILMALAFIAGAVAPDEAVTWLMVKP